MCTIKVMILSISVDGFDAGSNPFPQKKHWNWREALRCWMLLTKRFRSMAAKVMEPKRVTTVL